MNPNSVEVAVWIGCLFFLVAGWNQANSSITRDARERKGRTEPAGGKIKPVRSRLKIGLPTGLIGIGQVKPLTLSGQVPPVGIDIREGGVQGLYGLLDRRSAGSCAGVLAGVARADVVASNSGADALLASRLAAKAFSSGDIGQYDTLMAVGTRANLADNPGSAEAAFRAALALQQKALGKDNPDTATALMSLALQLSNEGRYAEVTCVGSGAATRLQDPDWR